jgi:hypothetical protein
MYAAGCTPYEVTSLDAAAINVMRSKKFKKREPKGGGLKTPTQA